MTENLLQSARRLVTQYSELPTFFDDDATALFEKNLLGQKRIALFTGRHSADVCGAFADLTAVAQKIGCEILRFNQITPEPDIEVVRNMVEFLRQNSVSSVWACGGGSVLDAAKAALAVCQSDLDLPEIFGQNRLSERFSNRQFQRVIAVPTTAGTGSESTHYANIVDRENGVKKLISDAMIEPQLALVCPRYSGVAPRQVALATGCDALAHLLEGFLNVGADGNHPLANTWAITGIRLIIKYLPRRLENSNDTEATRAIALAATLGGMTIRFKSTGLPHLCSFSWFGKIEHGIAAILLLPAAWRYYIERAEVANRTMELAEIFTGKNPMEIIASFRAFLTRIGVPADLAEYPEITPELLKKTAASGAQNKMKLELAPRPVPLEESEQILGKILQQSYIGD